MSTNWNHIIEDNEEKEEYIEVKQPHDIRAILKAEQDQRTKAHEESILKIIDEKPTEPVAPKPTAEKPKFIVDDRERVYPTQKPKVQETATSIQSGQNKPSEENRKESKEEQPPKRQNTRKQEQKIQQNQPQRNQKKVVYREKVQKAVQREDKPEAVSPKKKKYVQKLPEKMKRKQIEVVKGEEVTIELIEDEQHFQNQIYVGKRDVSIYFEKAKDLIQEYDFIVLKSFAIYVSKAFLVAGLMAREFPQLKQINIPSTAEVRIVSSGKQRAHKRGAVRIELSLNELQKNHIGYQEAAKVQKQVSKEPRKQYKEKEEPPKYSDKKPAYVEKQPSRRPRRQREGNQSEPDERSLR